MFICVHEFKDLVQENLKNNMKGGLRDPRVLTDTLDHSLDDCECCLGSRPLNQFDPW